LQVNQKKLTESIKSLISQVSTMKIVKYSLIVILCILVAIFFYRLRYNRNSEEYLPEQYVGPEIHLAAMQGNIEIVRTILSEKPELLTQTDKYGNSPLHLAAYKGHTEVVQFLILRGADVNVRNNFGGTALLTASYAGETEVIQVLIAGGADTNLAIEISKQQVLQIASLEGYRDYSHMYDAKGGIINVKVPLHSISFTGCRCQWPHKDSRDSDRKRS
jgi:ankyrin repeat protein